MWDPTTYLRYGDERSRPFHDLLARIGAERPRTVVDLGCGPGNLTMTLPRRWPDARIVGLDSSPEMIQAATEARPTAPDAAAVEFAVGDVRDWTPDPEVDVVISNAVLQWVPGHDVLLRRWARELPAGAWLAFQVPANFTAPSHRELRALANQPRWRDLVVPVLRSGPAAGEVGDDPVGYGALLVDAGCQVDAWETTYVHLLPVRHDAPHPVLSWLEGTALRPVRAVLGGGAAWDDFRAALGERLAAAYPVRNGVVYFPFRRTFVVARTGA